MESTLLGSILDSSVLIAAERRKLTREQTLETVRKTTGEIPIVLCALTIAEIGHGIYRANTPELRDRRRAFLDELKATVPIHPIMETTAEIVARIPGGNRRVAASAFRSAISSLGPALWNWGMPSATD